MFEELKEEESRVLMECLLITCTPVLAPSPDWKGCGAVARGIAEGWSNCTSNERIAEPWKAGNGF